MKVSTQLRLSAGSLAVGLALASTTAYAQDEGAGDSVDISTETGLDDVPTGTIVVTGSRIVRQDFGTVSPTITVGEELLENRQFNNVAEALNQNPFFDVPGQSPTGTIGNADVGQNFVNFFGLGSQRTLTTVNGRRVVAANAPTVFNNAAPGLQVDLNIIPTIMVDRIEAVAVRGAPIYGSDAISGTINVILKNDFEGLELDGNYGVTERGDSEEYRLSGLMGSNFADGRGNVTIAVEHTRTKGLLERDRYDFICAACSFQTNPLNTGPDDGIPDRVLIQDARVSFATNDGIPALFFGNPFFGVPITDGTNPILQFGPDGDLIPFDTGERFGAVFADGGDGVSISDINTLQSGVKRTVFAANGNYEITPGIEFFVETLFANTKGIDLGSQAVWNTDFFSDDGGAIQFNVNNPFLSSQAAGFIQSTCDANGLTDPADCNFLMARYGRTLTTGQNRTNQNLYRIVTGARGDFEIGGRSFNWEVAYNYGKTENNTFNEGVQTRRYNFALDVVEVDSTNIAAVQGSTLGDFINVSRGGQVLNIGLGDVQVGDIVCNVFVTPPTGTGDNVSIPDQGVFADAAACVPLNYFGENNTTPEAADYVTLPFASATDITQEVFTAFIGGGIFDVPAGEVLVNVGYEHRSEGAAFTPGSGLQGGQQQGNVPVTPTRGGYNTNEFFGELLVPILGPDMGLGPITRLEAEGAARYVDNSRAGTDWTWTVGGKLGLFDDQVTIRGNYTQSIRAPALVELFLPISGTNSRGTDPCDASNIAGGPNPENRQANCLAEAQALGVDISNFQSVIINGTRQGTTGGNPNLFNEKGTSWTVGAIIAPDFIPGRFSLGVDYVNIKLEDAISQLTLTNVFQACYDSDPGSFPNQFCDRFTRGSSSAPANEQFQVQNGFSTGFLNAGTKKFEAVTAQMSYANDVADLFGGDGDLGQISLNASLFHLITDDTSFTGFDLTNRVDAAGVANWRGQLNVNYDFENIGVFWQTRFVDSTRVAVLDSDEARDVLRIKDYWQHNMGVSFRPTDELEIRLNVNNVFDTKPPFASGATANAPFAYDIFGRTYRVGAKLTF